MSAMRKPVTNNSEKKKNISLKEEIEEEELDFNANIEDLEDNKTLNVDNLEEKILVEENIPIANAEDDSSERIDIGEQLEDSLEQVDLDTIVDEG
jgi:hypothetical protein